MSFISTILDYIMAFVNWVWGIPMLILLAGGGVYLLIRLHGVTLTKLPYILKNTIGKAFGKNNGSEDGKFSGWQAATGALASCLGTGNIVGTALAVAYGGPGAVFWLWVAGFVACTIKFCEVTMCMIHRHINKDTGEWEGGPAYYLSAATGKKWPGLLYGIFCLFAMLICASVQIGSGVDNLEAFGAPPYSFHHYPHRAVRDRRDRRYEQSFKGYRKSRSHNEHTLYCRRPHRNLREYHQDPRDLRHHLRQRIYRSCGGRRLCRVHNHGLYPLGAGQRRFLQ